MEDEMDGIRFVMLEAGIHVSAMKGEVIEQVKILIRQHPLCRLIYVSDASPATGWEFGLQWIPWVNGSRQICQEVFESIAKWITERLEPQDMQEKGPGFWEFSRCPVEDW